MLVWHPARPVKEGGCVDLYLRYPLVLFGSEGSALTPPLFLSSPRIVLLCDCSLTMAKDHFCYTFWHKMTSVCRCAFKHSFIEFIHSLSCPILVHLLLKTLQVPE